MNVISSEGYQAELSAIIPYLQCPVSQQSVVLEGDNVITADKLISYPILDGILCMLPDAAIYKDRNNQEMNETTKSVQDFYDQIGWEQDDDGNFEDALRFEDLRTVSSEYIKKCHYRVREAIEHQGQFLLDVASGPVQYDDYLEYHKGYQKRICVDISISALRAARKRLKEKALYILGDITQMPFKENSFDGIVSLHTIYHVPFERQAFAFEEIHRVLKPGKTAAIVYSWGENALFRKVPRFPLRALKSMKRSLVKILKPNPEIEGSAANLSLYSYQASPKWFLSQNWSFDFNLSSWRSVDVDLMKVVIQPWALGRFVLKLLFMLEQSLPKQIALWGQYPLIKIMKSHKGQK